MPPDPSQTLVPSAQSIVLPTNSAGHAVLQADLTYCRERKEDNRLLVTGMIAALSFHASLDT